MNEKPNTKLLEEYSKNRISLRELKREVRKLPFVEAIATLIQADLLNKKGRTR
jgi:hypothetical protein